MDRMGHGIYTQMDFSLLPPLYLIYAENPSDSGKVSVVLCFVLDRRLCLVNLKLRIGIHKMS